MNIPILLVAGTLPLILLVGFAASMFPGPGRDPHPWWVAITGMAVSGSGLALSVALAVMASNGSAPVARALATATAVATLLVIAAAVAGRQIASAPQNQRKLLCEVVAIASAISVLTPAVIVAAILGFGA